MAAFSAVSVIWVCLHNSRLLHGSWPARSKRYLHLLSHSEAAEQAGAGPDPLEGGFPHKHPSPDDIRLFSVPSDL